LTATAHNLAAQIFYDQTYLSPSSLTVRTDAHVDGFDLRAAAESEAAKAITEQTKYVRDLLPPKIELLWDWALEQSQDVLLKVLAVAVAHTVNRVRVSYLRKGIDIIADSISGVGYADDAAIIEAAFEAYETGILGLRPGSQISRSRSSPRFGVSCRRMVRERAEA
jgi:uncharacterized membrane protein YkvA (DUF1232 family)